MKISTVLKAAVVGLLISQTSMLAAQQASNYLHQYDVRSTSAAPFAQVNWLASGELTAKLKQKWILIEQINGVTVASLIDSLVNKHNFSLSRSQRYITERLVDVLDELEIELQDPRQVAIVALSLDDKKSLPIQQVFLTKAKYTALRTSNASKPAKPGVVKMHSHAQAIEDIDAYHQDLIQRFAYLKANGVDHQQAIAKIKQRVGTKISATNLRNLIGEVTAQFIDGHAGPSRQFGDNDVSPFVVKRIGERFVAINIDGKGFVDANFPYITHIDDKPISFWRDLMVPYIAKGSAQMVSRRALRAVTEIGSMRKIANLEAWSQVALRLVNADLSKSKRLILDTIPARDNPKKRLPKKQYQSRLLADNLGYLRIAQMNDDAVREIRQWMPKFKQTDGLIVDVRGNGGGSRKAWLELMPYFMQLGETHIGNVSAYRLYLEFDENHLAGGRFSYMLKDTRLDVAERLAINQFKQSFSPEWQFDKSEFSPYHYFMSSKRAGDHRYFYDKKVILLTNDGCFSATDIFVGAMKGWRNITVMGTDTGGGSARTVAEKLPNSKLGIRLASMVSFQPNGLLYDGRGINVDTQVLATPASLLIDGVDNQLNTAIATLLAGK